MHSICCHYLPNFYIKYMTCSSEDNCPLVNAKNFPILIFKLGFHVIHSLNCQKDLSRLNENKEINPVKIFQFWE